MFGQVLMLSRDVLRTPFAGDLEGVEQLKWMPSACETARSSRRRHMAVVQQPSGRGLDFTDGHEIVLVESPETIARACVALLSDPERCRAIGTAARQNAAARYNQLKNVIASVRQRLRSISIAETRASINSRVELAA